MIPQFRIKCVGPGAYQLYYVARTTFFGKEILKEYTPYKYETIRVALEMLQEEVVKNTEMSI